MGNIAIKIPQFRYGWQRFLNGVLANIQEGYMSTIGDDRLCPVLFKSWGGFFLIMPRCDSLSEQEYLAIDPKKSMKDLPVEDKPCSYGWLNVNGTKKIVAVDYGS